jgi:hypothetical protein
MPVLHFTHTWYIHFVILPNQSPQNACMAFYIKHCFQTASTLSQLTVDASSPESTLADVWKSSPKLQHSPIIHLSLGCAEHTWLCVTHVFSCDVSPPWLIIHIYCITCQLNKARQVPSGPSSYSMLLWCLVSTVHINTNLMFSMFKFLKVDLIRILKSMFSSNL